MGNQPDAGPDEYLAATLGHAEAERARLGELAIQRERRMRDLGEQLRAVSREHYQTRTRLALLEGLVQDQSARLADDYAAIRRLTGVADVAVKDFVVTVTSDPVVIRDGDQRYLLGRYAIDIDLDRGIRIHNLANTSERAGWDHPHVQGGVPCLGNLQEGCSILLGRYELVPLVSLLLQFLDSYDAVSAYAPLSLWRVLDA